MKTLEEIKDEYANEHRFASWQEMHYVYKGWGRNNWSIEIHINEVAKRYATEAVQADRERIKKELLDKGSVCADGNGVYSPEADLIDNLPIELK